jgi:hypothetical protein
MAYKMIHSENGINQYYNPTTQTYQVHMVIEKYPKPSAGPMILCCEVIPFALALLAVGLSQFRKSKLEKNLNTSKKQGCLENS